MDGEDNNMVKQKTKNNNKKKTNKKEKTWIVIIFEWKYSWLRNMWKKWTKISTFFPLTRKYKMISRGLFCQLQVQACYLLFNKKRELKYFIFLVVVIAKKKLQSKMHTVKI